jgi:hypothetical protein
MRQIILVLIALVALGTLMQAAWAEPAAPVGLSNKLAPSPEPAQNTLFTTPSIADFLGENWASSAYVPEVFYASASPKSLNGTIARTSYAFYDFLNNSSYKSPAPSSPLFYASAQNKQGVVPYTGESIYDFLNDDWTPSAPVGVDVQSPYKMHQMN